MRTVYRLLAVVGALAAAACSADKIAGGRQPVGPHFTITTSTVTCPDTISAGQSAQCVAYFYDQNNNLVSTTPAWSTTTPTLVSVNSSGVITGLAVGNAVVQATASGVTGSKTVYVKPGLNVSILGPTLARRWTTCTWTRSVSGGTAPYTYQWSDARGTGSSYDTGTSYQVDMISASDDIYLTVTDANGVQASASKHVNTSNTAPLC